MPPDVLPDLDVDRYLERIGITDVATADLATLTRLQYAHLVAVPFENLDIVFGNGVPHDQSAATNKVLNGRGGWCFELNASFARLLEHLGYRVRLLGAAVLLGGPTSVIDHLALDVDSDSMAEGPVLVDVGFGQNFVRPIELNRTGPQPGGDADYELFASPQGTTLTQHVDGVPEAKYRFKRVAHHFADFAAIAESLQADPQKHWRNKPFATRLLGSGADRVTLSTDRLRLTRDGVVTDHHVERADWDDQLDRWFAIERPGPWPAEATPPSE